MQSPRMSREAAEHARRAIFCQRRANARNHSLEPTRCAKQSLMQEVRKTEGTAARPVRAAPARATTGLPRLAMAGAFLVLYVALEWVSVIHEYKGVPITPWNPGLGAVFALMLFAGARYGLVLFIGVVIAEIAVLRSSLSWPIIIGIAGIIAIGYAGMTVIARRVLAFDAGLNHL